MTVISASLSTEWGTFIEPAPDLEDVKDPAERLGIKLHTRHRSNFEGVRGRNRILDAIADRMREVRLASDDQCSKLHYADVFECVRAHYGRIHRVIEVGVFTGGCSTLLAGSMIPFDFGLDLVDPNRRFLQFTHERIRRTFPEAIGRVRLFLGDLPTYVHRVLMEEPGGASLVHHDGSHDFTQVVKDLSALSFVRNQVLGLMIQDTHLRGRIEHCNFVDAAVYAVFGFNVTCQPMGSSYPEGHPNLEPNPYQGNYFLPNTREGMFIPFEGNTFLYPHPSMPIEAFLPKRG